MMVLSGRSKSGQTTAHPALIQRSIVAWSVGTEWGEIMVPFRRIVAPPCGVGSYPSKLAKIFFCCSLVCGSGFFFGVEITKMMIFLIYCYLS